MAATGGAPRNLKEEIQYLRFCLKQARESIQRMDVVQEWQNAPIEMQRIHKDIQDDIAALDMYLHTLEHS
jgi:hypothetical protein